jgi:hypothetical protein
MIPRRPIPALLTFLLLTGTLMHAEEAAQDDERAVENLAVFARAYGYVRFFYPGDRAAEADWDKIGVLGAEAAREAANPADLRAALRGVLQPIAPQLQISETAPTATLPRSSDSGRVTFWQRQGLKLTDQPSTYRQTRVLSDEPPGARHSLFQPATVPAPFTATLAPKVILHLPLALPVDAEGKTPEANSPESESLSARLAALDLKSLDAGDWRLRVAGIVTVWNVFQHFHPYLDGIGVKWEETLRPALRRALRDRTATDYHATLSELIAHTRDGHGFVYGRPPVLGGTPMRVAVVEGQIVVTAVGGGAPVRKGDIIERLDGVPAMDALRERERYVAGSPHLRRWRALNQFGEGPLDSVARLDLLREGARETVEFTRSRDGRGFFFNLIGEFEFPAFAEVRPGIFYVNLYHVDAASFAAKLPELAAARGVIFDWRSDGRIIGDPKAKRLTPHQDIIPHLIDRSIQASPMLVPQITAPDRVGWTYRESTWPVQPKAPRFSGRVVWINEPSVVSYGETCMAMIAHHRLATLVGAPTAGCNGNVNFIPLPGGFRVMWTGMDVLRMDRSPFYTVGFLPDVPVERTLRAVKEGRDEYLDAAIAVIEAAKN